MKNRFRISFFVVLFSIIPYLRAEESLYKYFPKKTFVDDDSYERYTEILDRLSPLQINKLPRNQNAVRLIKVLNNEYTIIKIDWTKTSQSLEYVEEKPNKKILEKDQKEISKESVDSLVELIDKNKIYKWETDGYGDMLSTSYILLIEMNINGKYKVIERYWPVDTELETIANNMENLYKDIKIDNHEVKFTRIKKATPKIKRNNH